MGHLPFFQIFKFGEDDYAEDTKDSSGDKPQGCVSPFSFGDEIANHSSD